ncbi:uncharacterized protein A4U43_C07F17020 [Asparagus officinalis]|uniref:Aquaporin n=1 Tax=Asparagus officinalis TaxID=4686 RepID=A0A5P1EFK4_ASPOF|nr:aquaporin SIP2-1 [Asparagus officinalis]ONK63609.1 uncharacterized protein A4U43_C07F17020 [Asparagus officinalis]
MGRMGLILWDFALSFMWAWAGSLAKLFVYSFLDWGKTPEAEALNLSLSVVYMYFFAWLGNFSRGGAYNPLGILSNAFMGGLDGFLFTVFGRIPAQIAGSIIGVRLIKKTFPQVGHGSRLNVDIHHGAMIEGLLTFIIVIVSLGLKKKDPRSFFMKTWIATISKISLRILGSDLTGGIMNPASALGWAYARGDHITKEHLLVYWFAPLQATILAVLVFKFFTEPRKSKEQKAKPE